MSKPLSLPNLPPLSRRSLFYLPLAGLSLCGLIALAALLFPPRQFFVSCPADPPAPLTTPSALSVAFTPADPDSSLTVNFTFLLDFRDDLLRVANKTHYLADYTPPDLITGAQGFTYRALIDSDLRAMLAAAGAAGTPLRLNSAYRSFSTQQALYNSYVARDGAPLADRYSARAGYSEHQLGLAVDFTVSNSFGITPAGRWLATHAHDYGFILRYTADNSAVTGYMSEPWHFRYIGRYNARLYVMTASSSLESFLSVLGGDYR
jgi:D-alanyl-D-alanine carboxypeptidase